MPLGTTTESTAQKIDRAAPKECPASLPVEAWPMDGTGQHRWSPGNVNFEPDSGYAQRSGPHIRTTCYAHGPAQRSTWNASPSPSPFPVLHDGGTQGPEPCARPPPGEILRSEGRTSELRSRGNAVC